MLKVKVEVVISNENGDMKVIDENLKMDFKELSKLEKFISKFEKSDNRAIDKINDNEYKKCGSGRR